MRQEAEFRIQNSEFRIENSGDGRWDGVSCGGDLFGHSSSGVGVALSDLGAARLCRAEVGETDLRLVPECCPLFC